MATTMYFVQGDTLPQIQLTLTRETDGTPLDLTGKEVYLHAKPSTGNGVIFSRKAVNANQTTSPGVATIVWATGDLQRPAGTYTGEVEIITGSAGGTITARETIYETFSLVIREDIGDALPMSSSTATTEPNTGDVDPP